MDKNKLGAFLFTHPVVSGNFVTSDLHAA